MPSPPGFWLRASRATGSKRHESCSLLAETDEAVRQAEAAGMEHSPRARHRLELAEQKLREARRLLEEDQTVLAVRLLERAEADAEVAESLARQDGVERQVQDAQQRIRRLKRQTDEGGRP